MTKHTAFLQNPKNKIPFLYDIPETSLDLFFKKITNLVMQDGKKTKALKIILAMFLILKNQIRQDLVKRKKTREFLEFEIQTNTIQSLENSLNSRILFLILRALENVKPSLEVRKVRVAGSTYLVPAVVSRKKQETVALKWIIESAKKRKKNTSLSFSECLAEEFLEASRKQGQARQTASCLIHPYRQRRADGVAR